ncbi:MAG: cytochrome c biogenesis protein ResB [Bacillota bacterium]
MQDTGTKWWEYPWQFLKSKRLAVILIVLLALFSAIGMIIPQIDPNPGNYQGWAVKYPLLAPVVESLGLNNIFRTWWFAALGVTFFTNLAACTLQQLRQCLKIWRRRHEPLETEPLAEFVAGEEYLIVRDEAVKSFNRAGYKYTGASGDTLFMEKHRWGIWGSLLFHVGLIIIVFGSLVSGAVKTTGYMMVAEGETRTERHDNYDVIYQGPFFKNEYHYGFDITLKNQQKFYDELGRLDYIKSNFVISENGRPVLEKSVSKGEPLLYRDIRFFEYDDGFTPLVTLKNPDGSIAWQTFLLLNTHRYATRRTYYYNNLELPNSPYTMSMEFFPDMAVKGKTVFNKSSKLNNPAAKVVIRKKGNQVAEKVIKPNESLNFNGYSFSFGEVRAWTGLEVVRDPGAGILFAGFWLALTGLVVLYFLRYQKVQLNFINDGQTTRVKICHYAVRHRKFLSDDIMAAAADLKNKLAKKE